MSSQSDAYETCASALGKLPTEELLRLIGDDEQRLKPAAMEAIVARGLDAVYPAIDTALRNDDDADVRNGAMEVLVAFGARAVPRLIRLLGDRNEEVRNFSTVMLGEIGSRDAVGPLIETLRDPDANVRHGAAEALGRIGDRGALQPLLDLLRDDFWQQYPAIVALGEMRDNRAVPRLVELLDDEMLGEPVIDALGKIGDPRPLVPLAGIIEADRGGRGAAAARSVVAILRSLHDGLRYKNSHIDHGEGVPLAIGKEGTENLKAMVHPAAGRETVTAAITLLGWLGESAILPDLFALLEQDDYLEAVESAILSIGDKASPSLVDALSHPSVTVRIAALRTLRWLGVTADARLLMPLLSDAEEKIRIEVLESIRGVTDEAFLPYLRRLMHEGGAATRLKALEVISGYPFATTEGILLSLLTAPEDEDRMHGAILFGLLRGGESTLLVPLFEDVSDSVRKEAAKAAGLRGLPDTVPLLCKLLSDPSVSVREEAVSALAEFGDRAPLTEIVQALGKDCERLDYAIVKAAGRIGSREAGQVLAAYLKHDSVPRLLEYAILEALGNMEGKAGPEHGVVARYLTHRDQDIRRLAVTTLVRIAGPDALPAVLDACTDPHWGVRIAAQQALGKIGGDRVLLPLVQGLADPDPLVRKNAILVLGDLRNVEAIPDLVRFLPDAELGRHAFESLLKFGRTALPRLQRAVKDGHSAEIRERIIDLIGKIGDGKSDLALQTLTTEMFF